MKRKSISIGALMLVLALLLTLMPACGEDEGEVKTLKIGGLFALSGPAAGWGSKYEQGVKWAADDFNAAGGIKVGDDRYMIEVVSCDTKYTGSVAAECAHRLVYDEGCKFIIGPIGPIHAVEPIIQEAQVLLVSLAVEAYDPAFTYHVNGLFYLPSRLDTWYGLVAKHSPELKTVAIINADTTGGHEYYEGSLGAAPKHGLTVVDHAFYESGTVDFYPLLMGILDSEPDAIETGGMPAGELCLITKQIRELGYEGMILQPSLAPIEQLIEIAGADNCWGIANPTQADYTHPMFTPSIHELYQRWLEKYAEPGETTMNVCVVHGYGHMTFIKTAIEAADSIDVDEVIEAFEDPDFRFERYLNTNAKLGGLETFGILRQFPYFQPYSEVWDAEVQIIDGAEITTP